MPTIRESIAKYLAELTRRGASSTRCATMAPIWSSSPSYFEAPGVTAPAFEQLDLALLREWLGGLYDHKLSVVTVRRKLAAVRAIFKFSMQEETIARIPPRACARPR